MPEDTADWLLEVESPADEMDDLQTVTLGERDVGPATSWSDLQVEFHSDPVTFQPEMLDKRSKSSSAGKFFGLPIHHDCHTKSVKEEMVDG